MTAQLCERKHDVKISQTMMADLDIFRLFRIFSSAEYPLNDDEIKEFLHNYLTSDTYEILRRSEIIHGLNANAESIKLMSSLMGEWKCLSNSLLEIGRSPRPLVTYTKTIHALRAYIASITHMENLFASENTLVMAEIAAVIRTEKESSFYSGVQDCLQYADRLMEPLDSVTLAVNMSEDGQARQIGVTDINRSEKSIVGMFSGARKKVNSLCNAGPVKLRSQLAHLEQYILSQVEKQWAGPLNAALRGIKKIKTEKLQEWLEWLRPIELYHKGLLLSDKLKEIGCLACHPDPCIDAFETEAMLYPHMVLSMGSPVPQNFYFSSGDAVMITGANNSGKTSSLKAFAQNCLFAQLGFQVPARSFRFIPFKQWSTVFLAGEDSQLHASRYQQEAERMRGAVASADSDTCLLFNEPFTSTNPMEAAELLRDIILQLHQKGTTLILVTHIYDVYELLRQAMASHVRSYVTGVDLNAEKPAHTYTLEEKEPDGMSYARLLAKEYGLCIENLIHDRDIAYRLEEFLAGGGNIAQAISEDVTQ